MAPREARPELRDCGGEPVTDENTIGEDLTTADEEHLKSLGFVKRELCTCGYPDGSFACRIRHIQINTGDAKAARDIDGGKR